MADMDVEVFDPGARRLCPDGSCVGLLGDDQRCRLCGLAEETGASADASADAVSGSECQGASADGVDAPDSFDTGRVLCPDGFCLGVLSPEGACPLCGLRAGG